MINEKTIWSSAQNNPELVVRDCIKEFNFNEEQCKKLRFILMNRGIGKWLLARVKFIKLKHRVKSVMKESIEKYGHKHPIVREIKFIQAEMQNIAKMPRYVIWGKIIHRRMRNNIKDIKIKGRHC